MPSHSPAVPVEVLEHVLGALLEGVLVVDASGRRIYANEEAARLTGYPSAEALLEAPPDEAAARFDIRDRSGRPIASADLPGRRVLAGEETSPMLVRFRSGDGPERFSEIRSVAVRDDDGTSAYVITYFREVTEQVIEADQGRLAEKRERAARAEAEAAAATLRKLERVSQAALEHLSLQDLLDALLGRIVEVLEADTAAILLVEADAKLHVRATAGGLGGDSSSGSRSARAWRAGSPRAGRRSSSPTCRRSSSTARRCVTAASTRSSRSRSSSRTA